MKATLYHNPRCSKSRATLDLLETQGVDVDVVEYLSTPPDLDTLRRIVRALGVNARGIIRDKEHAALELSDADTDDAWLQRIVDHPQIMQRPIVLTERGARIGRPPESVNEIL